MPTRTNSRASTGTYLVLSGTLLVLLLTTASLVRAEDVTTLSGTTYRQVRLVRVEPDGVVWEHATGICKVDFTDLPETLQKTYHYDATKAVAYQAAQTEARQQAAVQLRRDQQDAAVRRAKLLQEAAGTEAAPGVLTYRRRAADLHAEGVVGDQIAAKKHEQELLTKDDGTVWDRRLWAIPRLITGGSSDGTAFDPRTDLNAHEYQANLHHAPGGFAPDAAHDNFFQPDYQTKAYYKDVDRAAAFARGQP